MRFYSRVIVTLLFLHFRSECFTCCGELKSFVLDWGGVLQEIEIDTEHFDLHRSIPVDKDTLDELQKELDVDEDGQVTWQEFEKHFNLDKEEKLNEFPSDGYDVTEFTGGYVILAVVLVIITTAVVLWWFNRTTRDCRTSVNIQTDSDLRQIRMAALMPNKKGHHDDSNGDDTSSRVSTRGNSSSSQGGGQQSGSGQNSSNSQNTAGHQNTNGGGQLSSRGTAGQGSSSGGDGNDEEDKEKIKQPKDSDRQNEDEEEEESKKVKETTKATNDEHQAQASTQPAVKKMKVMQDAEDIRLKRLNKLQQSAVQPPVSSPAQTPVSSVQASVTPSVKAPVSSIQASVTPSVKAPVSSPVRGPTVSVDSKEPDVKQPVVKATAVTPTKKVVEKVSSPVKELDEEESQLAILSHLLKTKVLVQAGGSGDMFSDPSKVMKLQPTELPADPGLAEKFKVLLLRRLSRELDPVKVLVMSYSRACSSPVAGVQLEVWSQLTACSKKVCPIVLLEQLKEGVQTVDIDDIWSVYSSSSKSQTSLATFLNLLSTWSPDAVVVPPELLTELLRLAKDDTPIAREAFGQLVKTAGQEVKNSKSYEEIALDISKPQSALTVLFDNAQFSEFIGEQLVKEVETAISRLGVYFEKDSIFAGFLSSSTIPTKLESSLLHEKRYQSFIHVRGFPDRIRIDDIAQCCQPIQDGLHKCQECVSASLLKVLRTPQKSSAVGWLASVVGLNELRRAPQFRGQRMLEPVAGDGFMLNFSAVLLKLCQPFFANAPNGKLAKIDPNYCTSPHCRLDFQNEPCLAYGNISTARDLSKGHERYFPTDSSFNFMTEIFHITQRGLHVGLMAAQRKFVKDLSDLSRSIDNELIEEERKNVLKALRMLYILVWDCCLVDPQFVRSCSEFYITQAVWLMMQLKKVEQSSLPSEEALRMVAGIPEYSIKDMVNWFRFVAGNQPRLLSGLELTPFVDCCVALLQRPDILTGPVAQSKVVSVLLTFTEGSNQARSRSILSGAGWGSGLYGHLGSLVHTNPMVQEHLGPSLLSTYIAVDQIEGLDVDKEEFDKYGARYDIARLLEQLWGRVDCKESILKQTKSRRFQAFLGAVFDTLLYQLTDSLQRISNVKKFEVAKENKDQWNRLSPAERAEKEAFVAGEKSVTKSFMRMGTSLLDLLNQMVESPEVAMCFCSLPLSTRVSAAIFGFLNLLCGPKASELKVKDMDKYSFQPYTLLTQLVNILLMICRQEAQPRACDGFVSSLALFPDYSRATMDKVASVIQRRGSLSDDVLTQLISLIEEVEVIRKKDKDTNDALLLESADSSQASGSSEGGGAKFGGLPQWQQEIESITINNDDLNSLYTEALQDSKYDSCEELSETHALASHAVQTLDPRSSKTKALMKEMEALQEMLPLHIDSSVFVLQDEERMDLMRAIVTGPGDTPYSKGCFVFDIYFPSTYPNNPPLVKLITTGNGTVRFNPNLYADGKVCLSLLGTWHGGDATEKWDPQHSNLFQVLVSIQGLILIKDPMFNEPSYEKIQGTKEGDAKSAEYNADLHVHTVRYAMLEQLRNPPKGCEDIIKVHFTMQKDAVLKQCSEWLRQVVSPEQERRLRKAVDELRIQLDKIE